MCPEQARWLNAPSIHLVTRRLQERFKPTPKPTTKKTVLPLLSDRHFVDGTEVLTDWFDLYDRPSPTALREAILAMPYQFCNKGRGALDVQRSRREVFADRTVTTDRYADGSFDQLISYPDGTFDTISGSKRKTPR